MYNAEKARAEQEHQESVTRVAVVVFIVMPLAICLFTPWLLPPLLFLLAISPNW